MGECLGEVTLVGAVDDNESPSVLRDGKQDCFQEHHEPKANRLEISGVDLRAATILQAVKTYRPERKISAIPAA